MVDRVSSVSGLDGRHLERAQLVGQRVDAELVGRRQVVVRHRVDRAVVVGHRLAGAELERRRLVGTQLVGHRLLGPQLVRRGMGGAFVVRVPVGRQRRVVNQRVEGGTFSRRGWER